MEDYGRQDDTFGGQSTLNHHLNEQPITAFSRTGVWWYNTALCELNRPVQNLGTFRHGMCLCSDLDESLASVLEWDTPSTVHISNIVRDIERVNGHVDWPVSSYMHVLREKEANFALRPIEWEERCLDCPGRTWGLHPVRGQACNFYGHVANA